MKGRTSNKARGQPLTTFVLLMTAWIIGRVLMWETPFVDGNTATRAVEARLVEHVGSAPTNPLGQNTNAAGLSETEGTQIAGPEIGFDSHGAPLAPIPQAPFAWPQGSTSAPPPPLPSRDPQVAASHQLLWMAALAYMPMPEVLSERTVTPTGPDHPKSVSTTKDRWTLDGWTLWRQGSGQSSVSQGRVPTYGASQAGAMLAYRLAPDDAHDPRTYLRAYKALLDQGEKELAAGLSARPLATLPLRAYAEVRATEFVSGTHLRPTVLIATELSPQKLPGAFRAELYAQGGYVAGKAATGFADGQLHVLHNVKRFDLARVGVGGASWAGIQQGARRLDLGPTMRVDVTLGETPARLSFDWRERVAGNADPDSGLAVTLSTRF